MIGILMGVSGMGLNCVFGTPSDEAVSFYIKRLKICWFRKKTSGSVTEDLQSEKTFQSLE